MYSQEEIIELKAELLRIKEKLQINIAKAKTEVSLMRNQSPNDEGDYAVLTNDSSVDLTLIEKQVKELEEIEVALDKISNGNYGICEMCEELIGIDRLRVKPYAKYCITCREIIEKGIQN